MAIESKLSNIRKITNSSLNSIIDITNLNFKDLSEAVLLFLDTIDYDEKSNSINGLNTLNSNFVNVNSTFTMNLNGVPTWTIDSQGRAIGKSFLVEIAEARRYRHSDFPNWPDVGTVGEIIYTGIQNQRPEFGEDFIGYLDGRGWVSLTGGGGGPQQGIFILQEVGSPGIPATPPMGSGLVWVGSPGLQDTITPVSQDIYFTDENGNIFSLTLGGGGGVDLDWLIIGNDLKQGTTGDVFPNTTGTNNLGSFSSRWNSLSIDTVSFGAVPGMSIYDSGGNLRLVASTGSSDIELVAQDNIDFTYGNSAIFGTILTISNAGMLYNDGNQNAGYVLTSDAFGNATWQAPTGGGANVAYTEIINITSGVPYTVTHNLNSEYIHVSSVELPSEVEVDTEVSGHTLNTVDITSSVTTQLRVTILSAGGIQSIADDGDWVILGSPGMDLQMGVPGDTLPYADSFNNLGTDLLKWLDVHTAGTLFIEPDGNISLDGNIDTNGLYYNSTTNEVILYSGASDDIRISGNTGSQVILESDSNKQIILKTNGVLDYDVDRSASYTNRSIVDKEYIDGLVAPSYIMSPDDKFLNAITTVSDGDLASNSSITNTPVDGCYVEVKVNGIEYEVGNGVDNKTCYFADPIGSPIVPRGFSSSHPNGQVQAGDKLYWNGSNVGFQLLNGWRVSFHYLTN